MNKDITWHEIRHNIYTLRRMRWRFWQLTDSNKRIIKEGTRSECLDAMEAIRGGRHVKDFKLCAVPAAGR